MNFERRKKLIATAGTVISIAGLVCVVSGFAIMAVAKMKIARIYDYLLECDTHAELYFRPGDVWESRYSSGELICTHTVLSATNGDVTCRNTSKDGFVYTNIESGILLAHYSFPIKRTGKVFKP